MAFFKDYLSAFDFRSFARSLPTAVKADCRSNPSSWSLLDTSQMHEVPTTDDCTLFLAKGGQTVL